MAIAFDTSAVRKMLSPDSLDSDELRVAAEDALDLCLKMRDEGDNLIVPSLVVAELCAWPELTQTDRLEMLQRMDEIFNIIPFSEGAGQLSGVITAGWKQKQRRSPHTSTVAHNRDLCKVDHMILGVSIEQGCKFLVTHNPADFELHLPVDMEVQRPKVLQLAGFVAQFGGNQRDLAFPE